MNLKPRTIPANIQAKADAFMSASRARFGHDAFRMERATMPDAAQLARVRNADNYSDRNDLAADATKAAKQTFAVMEAIINGAHNEGRSMKASEQRDYNAAEKVLDEMTLIRDSNKVDRTGVVAPSDEAPEYRHGHPLAKGQSFGGAVRALSLDERPRRGLDHDDEPVNFSTTLRNAMSGGTATAGGFALPTILTADLVDLARNKSRVLEAGARVVPMANRTVDVPRWTDAPTPEWRAENAPITEDDGAIDKLTLTAHTLAVVTKVSRELIEDTSLEDDLRAAFAAAFALRIDLAATYGTGAADQPLGIKNHPDVTKTPMATNGAVPTWDALVDAVGRLRDVNEEPNAQLMSDRTARTLAKQKDADNNYIGAPSYLDGVTRFSTNQVPNNLTVGTGVDTSDVLTADWSQLYLGVRTQLQITLLSERYMVDAGQYAFVAWWRGDVQVARPKAFDVLTGVKAS